MEKRVPSFTLITQNVDGLHLSAGSHNVVEMHGNLWKIRCTQCGRITTNRSLQLGPQPTCGVCGGLLRPHVVWFGEPLDPVILQRAVAASRGAGVMLVIGTSSMVQPAASLSLEAKSRGGLVAEINLEKTTHSDFMDIALRGKAGEIVPRLVEDWE
jgi:NAD-dependent deacetylase